MRDLNTLSRVGFGAYRTSVNQPEHADALRLALSLGENLIDTAHGYLNGASEQLIGSVIHEFNADEIFIISKAGYIPLNQVETLGAEAQRETVPISNTYSHCIHPDFLELTLETSLKRIKRPFIDGYLLHNPEYQLNDPQHGPEMYQRIKTAFQFYEEQVKAGKIRWYGISSNTLPLSPDLPDTMRMEEIMKIVAELGPGHHFKFIQFPFNLIENSAYEQTWLDGKNLIDFARANGLVTFGNRPFNANTPNGTIRLANNSAHISPEQIAQGSELMGKISETIRTRMQQAGWKDDDPGAAFLAPFLGNWQHVSHLQHFDYVFREQFIPLMHRLFETKVPDDLSDRISEMKEIYRTMALSNMNRVATAIKGQLQAQTPETPFGDKPLQTVLCEKYLEAGIDHVLAGMRSPAYVRDFQNFFS